MLFFGIFNASPMIINFGFYLTRSRSCRSKIKKNSCVVNCGDHAFFELSVGKCTCRLFFYYQWDKYLISCLQFVVYSMLNARKTPQQVSLIKLQNVNFDSRNLSAFIVMLRAFVSSSCDRFFDGSNGAMSISLFVTWTFPIRKFSKFYHFTMFIEVWA